MSDDQKNSPLWKMSGLLKDLQAQEDQQRQEWAESPHGAKDPPTYEEAAAKWALRDKWTIAEAANLLCRCEPLRPTGLPGHDELDKEVREMRRALKRSILRREGKGDDAEIVAGEAVEWAQRKGMAIPEALRRAMGLEQADRSASDKAGLSSSEPSLLRIERERCRAIAQTLWREDPQRTIADIIRHPDLQEYGKGKRYRPETLRDWIKDLDPRPAGQREGRPRKYSGDE